jgi:hypothetical protein
MFRPDPTTQTVVWTLERGGPVNLSDRQTEDLLALFSEVCAREAFNDLCQAYVAVGGVPIATSFRKARDVAA